ncbi:hypothetical protein [Hymenobacter sp. 102]|uniref:hypothetical protein n=1 Tax=Hymenobacter sp. 102 TaxID=3403152 RepID=UPI003CF43393
MNQENIWKNFDFSKSADESAYNLLISQSDQLLKATGGELKMDVDAIDSYKEGDPVKIVAIYTLYVVAPKLGNFRRKILNVVEGESEGRFPVDIYCVIDGREAKGVNKIDFLETVAIMLKSPRVKSSIENLFQQSKQNNKEN